MAQEQVKTPVVGPEGLLRSRWTWVAVVLLVAIVAVGWLLLARRATPDLPEPARVVQEVLEMRRARSTDASGYAQYFEEASVATALAQDASATADATGTAGPPIPDWKTPYVSAQTSETADVMVVWKPDRRFEEWAAATIFKMKKLSGLWKISDAQELTSTVPPAGGSMGETGSP